MGGVTFTWLASGQILKVGGTHVFKLSFVTEAISKHCGPAGPPTPHERGRRAGGPAERCGASRSCDSALGWGHGSFPLLSLVWGAARQGAEAQTRSGGRGASTVQDAHRWRAEVTRLVVGPGPGP